MKNAMLVVGAVVSMFIVGCASEVSDPDPTPTVEEGKIAEEGTGQCRSPGQTCGGLGQQCCSSFYCLSGHCH